MLAVSNATVGINPSSFYTVAKASVPSFTKLIDVAVMIKCFGVGTSYLIVIGDLAPDVPSLLALSVQSSVLLLSL